MGRLIRSEKCICGKPGILPLPKKIDELVEIIDDKDGFGWSVVDYTKLCPACLRRVERLLRRFKPGFFPAYVSMVYDRKHDILTIKAGNEYGDTATISERSKSTFSAIRNLWTDETIILSDGEMTGVI